MSIINISSNFYNIRTKSPQRQKQENRPTLIAFDHDGYGKIACNKPEKAEFHTGTDDFQQVLSKQYLKKTPNHQTITTLEKDQDNYEYHGEPLEDYLAKLVVEKITYKYE